MRKRIASLLLILALCFTLLPTAVLAADGAWDGSIATAFAGGTGTGSDPYQIADGAQLAYLASEVNKGQTYENSYFVLTADIDLANHDWTPIGNSFSDALFDLTDYRLFAGNLDGKERGDIRNKHPFGHEADFYPSPAPAIQTRGKECGRE